jgi:hypothetical protein
VTENRLSSLILVPMRTLLLLLSTLPRITLTAIIFGLVHRIEAIQPTHSLAMLRAESNVTRSSIEMPGKLPGCPGSSTPLNDTIAYFSIITI